MRNKIGRTSAVGFACSREKREYTREGGGAGVGAGCREIRTVEKDQRGEGIKQTHLYGNLCSRGEPERVECKPRAKLSRIGRSFDRHHRWKGLSPYEFESRHCKFFSSSSFFYFILNSVVKGAEMFVRRYSGFVKFAVTRNRNSSWHGSQQRCRNEFSDSCDVSETIVFQASRWHNIKSFIFFTIFRQKVTPVTS